MFNPSLRLNHESFIIMEFYNDNLQTTVRCSSFKYNFTVWAILNMTSVFMWAILNMTSLFRMFSNVNFV